jgi:hypothetical protein
MMIVKYIRYPDSVMAYLAVAITIATIDGLFQMCDHLLDQPPAIFWPICRNPRIISPMPPHDLTPPHGPSKDYEIPLPRATPKNAILLA